MRVLLLAVLLVAGCGGSGSSKPAAEGARPEDPKADGSNLDPDKVDVARQRAEQLVLAVQTYYVKHSQFPADLSVLTEPDEENNKQPYVTSANILDPWGKPYQLDTSGPKPVVFTTSPLRGKRISNKDQ